jgi:hypothetical protein
MRTLTLSRNVLASGGTTLNQGVKHFLDDDVWLAVFVADPAIAAFPERMNALHQDSETPGPAMPATQQGPAPSFKVALSARPDRQVDLITFRLLQPPECFRFRVTRNAFGVRSGSHFRL